MSVFTITGSLLSKNGLYRHFYNSAHCGKTPNVSDDAILPGRLSLTGDNAH